MFFLYNYLVILYFNRYLQNKYKEKQLNKSEEDSDLESVASEEFEEMLDKMGGFSKDEDDDLDYMGAVGENIKTAKKKGLLY